MRTINSVIVYAIAVIGLFGIFSSCNDDKDTIVPVTDGTVLIQFKNYCCSEAVELGNIKYFNAAGNKYSIDMLKYYISNIQFIKDDNSIVKLPNYELVSEQYDTSQYFSLRLPYGNYKKMIFLLGVDSIKNYTGAQAGELGAEYGMFWDWNTGYVYLKHEGNFIDTNGDTLPVISHFGALEALSEHEINFTLPVSTEPRILKVSFDLNKMYSSPNQVNFHNNNIHSGGSNWVTTLRDNLQGAFATEVVL